VEVTTLERSGFFILLFLELSSERVPLSTLNCGLFGTKTDLSQGKNESVK
jgi:hypothetical protein